MKSIDISHFAVQLTGDALEKNIFLGPYKDRDKTYFWQPQEPSSYESNDMQMSPWMFWLLACIPVVGWLVILSSRYHLKHNHYLVRENYGVASNVPGYVYGFSASDYVSYDWDSHYHYRKHGKDVVLNVPLGKHEVVMIGGKTHVFESGRYILCGLGSFAHDYTLRTNAQPMSPRVTSGGRQVSLHAFDQERLDEINKDHQTFGVRFDGVPGLIVVTVNRSGQQSIIRDQGPHWLRQGTKIQRVLRSEASKHVLTMSVPSEYTANSGGSKQTRDIKLSIDQLGELCYGLTLECTLKNEDAVIKRVAAQDPSLLLNRLNAKVRQRADTVLRKENLKQLMFQYVDQLEAKAKRWVSEDHDSASLRELDTDIIKKTFGDELKLFLQTHDSGESVLDCFDLNVVVNHFSVGIIEARLEYNEVLRAQFSKAILDRSKLGIERTHHAKKQQFEREKLNAEQDVAMLRLDHRAALHEKQNALVTTQQNELDVAAAAELQRKQKDLSMKIGLIKDLLGDGDLGGNPEFSLVVAQCLLNESGLPIFPKLQSIGEGGFGMFAMQPQKHEPVVQTVVHP